jgi:hypothetical protein
MIRISIVLISLGTATFRPQIPGAQVAKRIDEPNMKSFWITYTIVTLALLAFCYSFLGVLTLCAAVTGGAAASSLYLFRKRNTLALQKHLVPVALLASFGSVASGFILILAVVLLGEFFR